MQFEGCGPSNSPRPPGQTPSEPLRDLLNPIPNPFPHSKIGPSDPPPPPPPCRAAKIPAPAASSPPEVSLEAAGLQGREVRSLLPLETGQIPVKTGQMPVNPPKNRRNQPKSFLETSQIPSENRSNSRQIPLETVKVLPKKQSNTLKIWTCAWPTIL